MQWALNCATWLVAIGRHSSILGAHAFRAPSPGASYPSTVVTEIFRGRGNQLESLTSTGRAGAKVPGGELSDRIGLDRALLVAERGPLDEMPGEVASTAVAGKAIVAI
jgi:hypothetical protein